MRFGLLGRKLGHSYSPQIHAMLGEYEYPLYEKEPEEVEEFLLSGDFDGMNVTIPYKETVMPYMAALSDSAKKIGSVNTVTRLPDGSLYGDNTDYYGFSFMLDSAGFDVEGKKVIVLGSGGASKTAVCVCRDRNAGSVTVISRSSETDNYDNIAKHADADYIINTTPVGMFPNNGKSPIDLELFTSCKGVADLIYNPSKTKLLLDAQQLSIPAVNGLTMLCAQAAKAAESFIGIKTDSDTILEIVRKLENQMLNIVLVGMPGCGKSTAAKNLAAMLGREMLDTDSLIVKNEGRSIPEIFASEGEEYFRNAESLAIEQAGRQSGKIIATGGGAVIRESNKLALRQNSVVVFLTRNTAELDIEGRPLSQGNSLEEMHKKRLPHYEAVCDIKVEVAAEKEETARRILKGLDLI